MNRAVSWLISAVTGKIVRLPLVIGSNTL